MLGYLVYIIFGLLLTSLSVLNIFFKNKYFVYLALGFTLLFYCFLGTLKSPSVGVDSFGYLEIYNNLKQMTFSKTLADHKPEFLFYGTMYISSAIFKLPKIFFDFLNFFIISISLFFAFKEKELPFLDLLVFSFIGFFCMSFSGIRQSVAIAISTLAIELFVNRIYKRNYLRYVVFYFLALIAVMYHTTAVFVFFVPLFLKIRFKRYQFPWITLFFLIIPFIFSRLYQGINAVISIYYEPYGGRLSFMMIAFIIFIWVFYFVFYSSFAMQIKNKLGFEIQQNYVVEYKINAYIVILYLFLLFTSLNIASSTITRIAMYFYIAPAMLVSCFVCWNKKLVSKIVITSIVSLLFFAYFVMSLKGWLLIPYAFK